MARETKLSIMQTINQERTEQDLEALTAERALLLTEKMDLTEKLAALGISGNRAYFARGTISKAVWNQRTEWATRYAQIETRLSELKKILNEANKGKHKDHFKEIITEALGLEYVRRVIKECERRREGLSPIKVSARLPVPVIKTYKTELIQLYESLIQARKVINKFISDGEPEINKADYLRSVSPINNSIPSIIDLEKTLRSLKK